MFTLDAIRRDMETQLKTDATIRSVEVSADTLDEALSDAAIQLNAKVSNLEYEIVERGSDGFLGFARKNWTLKVYPNAASVAQKKKAAAGTISIDDELAKEQTVVDRDGLFFVHRFASQLNLKVELPLGRGKPALLKDVLGMLKRSDTQTVEEDRVKEFVRAGTNGVYEPVGTYEHVKTADALVAVDISKDEMHAMITVTSPALGGADISADQIRRALDVQGIVAGIDEDKISKFVDTPVYNVPYEVASGIPPVDGRDAYIAYNFETDRTKLRVKEAANGQVNFKELNLIQNVVEGQPLAQKMLAERGKSGKTLLGRYLEAKNGKDINLPLGKNVSVDSDGQTILASVNGQVLVVGDKINVEPILELEGVNIKTGHVTFLGTVVVRGNVEDGFNLKASGNIEIYGTVGKSRIEAGGDIIVSQGVFGRDEGSIHTEKSLWAKFVQATTVDAGDYIIVSDSIMNSTVTAMKRIILQGKKAQITGGHLFATEEISAKNIGSPGGGAETVLEVGFDPKAKHRMEELQKQQGVLLKELEEVELDLATLENQKKIRRTLPPDKEENLEKLKERRQKITSDSSDMSGEIQKIQEHLRALKVVGKVKASGTVYAGVKIYVRDVIDEIRSDVHAVTFYYENGFVRRGKYEAPAVEDIKAPDGYSSY